MNVPNTENKPTLHNKAIALKTLKHYKVDVQDVYGRLAILTDNGYEEVKIFRHKAAGNTFEIVLTSGKRMAISEILFMQDQIKESRKESNTELNFKNSHKK